MLAAEAHETTSAEESKPVSSKVVTRKNDGGRGITAYNLTLSIHCTDCQGPNPNDPEKQHENCVSKDKRIAAKKPGYFDTADFKTPPPRAEPPNISWMYGLEEFFEAVPAGETPRIKLEGNFCKLAANYAEGLSEGTVDSIISNMMESSPLDTDLWKFLFGLKENALSFEEPLVYFERIDQAKDKDGQDEWVFRVKIEFS